MSYQAVSPAPCVACKSVSTKLVTPRNSLHYVCCTSCGHCTLDGTLLENASQNADAFEAAQDKYYGEESILITPDLNAFESEIINKRKSTIAPYLTSPAKVLEVGPGAGHILRWLLSQGHSPTAVEHSQALARALTASFSIPMMVGEFEKLPVEKNAFDAFFSFHVIEHVRDPLAHLVAAFDAVRPGGLGFIATPNARSLQQLAFPSLSPNFDSAHAYVFSPESLRHFAERAGWRVLAQRTPEYTPSWLRVATKAVRRMKGEDEEATAGKYAAQASSKMRLAAKIAAIVSWPLRAIQSRLRYGNEIFFVLVKPN